METVSKVPRSHQEYLDNLAMDEVYSGDVADKLREALELGSCNGYSEQTCCCVHSVLTRKVIANAYRLIVEEYPCD